MPTAAEIMEHVFTSTNPATGSQPPPEIAWVVFANGTAFFTIPTDDLPATASLDAVEAAGRAALAELGPVHVGTPSADFNPTRLSAWYPDAPVWFVGFDSASIVTIIELDATELVAGLEARRRRQLDHDDPQPVVVRGFDGTHRAAPEGGA